MDDVRDERPRIPIWPQPCPGLIPDQVALGDEADRRRAAGQVGPGEDVAPTLVGVAHDDHGIATVAQDAVELREDEPHPVQEGRVVGGIGEVVRRIGDHRIVRPPVGMRLGERSPGHRHRQLEVVGRVRCHHVHRSGLQARKQGRRIAHPEFEPCRVESPRTSGIRAAQIDQLGTQSAPFGGQLADDPLVDRSPARIELDADGTSRAARDRRSQQGSADARERVEYQLARPAEELDQARHQPGRLVRAMGFPGSVPELRRIGRRQERLREVEPLVARQLVQGVGGVGRSSVVGHQRAA